METNTNPIYSFYFSMRGNMRMPLIVGYFFIGYGAIASILTFGLGVTAGPIMLVCAPILFFLIKEHLQIDFATKKYRYAIDFCGFNFGQWLDLPPIEYVSVFVAKYRSGSQGGNDSKQFKKLEINLIYPTNKRLNVWIGNDIDNAFEAARFLSKSLDVKILNATKKPFVWLE